LVGFTTLSESMGSAQLVEVLNEYLTEMSDIILKHDGVVDKYIGDAIMAFWNAPIEQPRHASLACFTALDQMEQLAVLQKRFAERGLPFIDCRIGINTGVVHVGNMGSKTRFDYTVMGDTVNLASRLEGANKPYHTHIMISEFTCEEAKDDIEVRVLDLLRVKGKTIPIKVFELLARKGQLTPDRQKAFALYQDGLNFYYDRKFEKALEKFKKVGEVLPEDGPSLLYMERCRDYAAAPPPKDWDGVYVMTTK
ncbi:MAG: adenylate/guanylate cyclase domain-containing protein, partial [Elusimicrobia bacterium]|nr:adenylate/guanylate cyclase domain-containing protein [Elusimicrobiota bacterium]